MLQLPAVMDNKIASCVLTNRFGAEHRRRRQLNKEKECENRERMLYCLKETPMPKILPNFKTAGGLNCTTCVIRHEKRLDFDINLRRTLVDVLEEKPFYPQNITWALRCMNWFIRKFLPNAVTSLLVHPGQITTIKTACMDHPEATIIFLLNNKCLMDHLLMKFVLINNGISSPFVIMEDDLHSVFGVNFLMRKLGIISNNEKFQQLLLGGENMQIFLNYDQGPAQIKTVVKLVEDKSIPEVLIVPVSIAYEKENFQELTEGKFAAKPTFLSVYHRLWNTLKLNFGMIHFNFNEPYLATQWIQALKDKNASADLSKQITQHAFQDNQQTISIMSTNVIAFLLLNRYTHGATKGELIMSLDQLRHTLRRDYCFVEDSATVVDHALELFAPNLIHMELDENEQILFAPNLKLPYVAELVSYCKPLRNHFALQSIVATAALDLYNTYGYMQNMELMASAIELCDLLSEEIVLCKPCQNLEYLINDAIHELVLKDIFKEKTYTEDERRGRSMFRDLEGFSDDDEYTPRVESEFIKINIEEQESMNQIILLLSPILVTYLDVAECVFQLLDVLAMSENEFLTLCMQTISTNVANGKYEFAVSISLDSVKCCLNTLIKRNIIEVNISPNGIKMVSLGLQYQNVKSIQNLYNQIDRFVLFK